MPPTPLVVDFLGEVYKLQPGETLEFGRGAQLDIDDKPPSAPQAGPIRAPGGVLVPGQCRPLAAHLRDRQRDPFPSDGGTRTRDGLDILLSNGPLSRRGAQPTN